MADMPALYQKLLRLSPASFRAEYGREMTRAYEESVRDRGRAGRRTRDGRLPTGRTGEGSACRGPRRIVARGRAAYLAVYGQEGIAAGQ